MNKSKRWNHNKRGGFQRGGFRGGRGGNRGWSGNQRGGKYTPHWGNFDGYGGGNRYTQNNYNDNNKGQWQWKKQTSPGKRLSEQDIGVTEYISEQPGFNGIIKSRYSDFQVSEISETGEIAKLTCTNAPEPPEEEELVVEDEDLLLSKYNLEILPTETWDKINMLAMSSDPNPDCVEIDMAGVTKEERTKIHDAVKKAFGESIVGSTVNIDDKKLMRFQKYRKGVRIDNRVKWTWPGEYVYFVVHKENCDTMDAAMRITERIGIHMKPSMLGYAGTKDRRAKTTQWFSAKRIEPKKFVNACQYFKDIHVGNFTFKDTCLKLGMLKGNRFRIALRNVKASDELVNAACKDLQEKGFINYYGLQRFGSRIDTPTYNIGLKLLQGNFKEAISLILSPREGLLLPALRAYAAGAARVGGADGADGADGVAGAVGAAAAAAAAMLPRRAASTAEARLLRALAECPNDLLGALAKLPRNTRLLYLHSYQSLIWNKAVSERIRRFGLKPAVGDLVALTKVDLEKEFEDDDEDEETEENQNEESENQEMTDDATPEPNSGKDVQKSKNSESTTTKVPVKVLTQEDIDSGTYTMFDIVMPLPGYLIEYPPNMEKFYEECLTKDGLTMKLKHKIKSYSMSGAYRVMCVRPAALDWRCVRYADPYADLLLSDLDELHGAQRAAEVADGKYKALLLNMTLPASCYATMALRELLKVDTSSDKQALQNNYHKEDDNNEQKNGENEEELKGENGEKRKLTSDNDEDAKKQKLDE